MKIGVFAKPTNLKRIKGGEHTVRLLDSVVTTNARQEVKHLAISQLGPIFCSGKNALHLYSNNKKGNKIGAVLSFENSEIGNSASDASFVLNANLVLDCPEMWRSSNNSNEQRIHIIRDGAFSLKIVATLRMN